MVECNATYRSDNMFDGKTHPNTHLMGMDGWWDKNPNRLSPPGFAGRGQAQGHHFRRDKREEDKNKVGCLVF